MKTIFRFFRFGALILLMVVTACAPTDLTPFPTPPGFQPLTPENNNITATPLGTDTTATAATAKPETALPAGTVASSPTSGTVSAQIPVTGLNISLLDCPFCVNERAYNMLLMPDTATFKVISNTASNPPTCTTIDVTNGKQVVMCAGSKKSLFTLNVCNNAGGCVDYPVALIDCIVPGLPSTDPTTTRGSSTPTNTTPVSTNTSTIPPVPTNTPIAATNTSPPIATDTAIPSVTDTPTP